MYNFKDNTEKWFTYGCIAAFMAAFASPELGGTILLIVILICVGIIFFAPTKKDKE